MVCKLFSCDVWYTISEMYFKFMFLNLITEGSVVVEV